MEEDDKLTDMSPAATARVIAACALALAGCGAPTCDEAVGHAYRLWGLDPRDRDGRAAMITSCRDERWSANLRTCLKRATSPSDLEACSWHAPRRPLTLDDYNKARRGEAAIVLAELRRRLKARYRKRAAFPKGIAPLTPQTPCCESADNACPPSFGEWNGVWSQVPFSIAGPQYFQYSYASVDGQAAIVEAVGDIDCDGTVVTFTLRCEAPGGKVACTLAHPAQPD